MPATASRLSVFSESVIRGTTRLANQHGAINLAQGFPDFDCDPALVAAVSDAMARGLNQYPPMTGVPALRQAIAAKLNANVEDLDFNPDDFLARVKPSEDAREAKRVELCGLKVPALKGLCDEHKLSKAGVKADLVSRLCDALAPVAIAKRIGEAPRTGEAARETKLAELRALKVPELKQLCDQHDVRKTGKKEELVARLCDALSNAEQPVEKKNFSKAEVLKMLDLPEMHSLLRQKRLRWVGHALRRKDGDLSKDTVKQELARKSSTWTACVLSDMEALNIGGVVALEREANNRESFRKLTSAYIQK